MPNVCSKCRGTGQETIYEEVEVLINNKIVKQKVPKTVTCRTCNGRGTV